MSTSPHKTIVCLIALMSCSCAHYSYSESVRIDYAYMNKCRAFEVKVQEFSQGEYHASGCGGTHVYICENNNSSSPKCAPKDEKKISCLEDNHTQNLSGLRKKTKKALDALCTNSSCDGLEGQKCLWSYKYATLLPPAYNDSSHEEYKAWIVDLVNLTLQTWFEAAISGANWNESVGLGFAFLYLENGNVLNRWKSNSFVDKINSLVLSTAQEISYITYYDKAALLLSKDVLKAPHSERKLDVGYVLDKISDNHYPHHKDLYWLMSFKEDISGISNDSCIKSEHYLQCNLGEFSTIYDNRKCQAIRMYDNETRRLQQISIYCDQTKEPFEKALQRSEAIDKLTRDVFHNFEDQEINQSKRYMLLKNIDSNQVSNIIIASKVLLPSTRIEICFHMANSSFEIKLLNPMFTSSDKITCRNSRTNNAM